MKSQDDIYRKKKSQRVIREWFHDKLWDIAWEANNYEMACIQIIKFKRSTYLTDEELSNELIMDLINSIYGEDCISVADIVILMIKHEGINLSKLNKVLEKKKSQPKKLLYSKSKYRKIPTDRKKRVASDFWKKQLNTK